jgi:hypothetical protein
MKMIYARAGDIGKTTSEARNTLENLFPNYLYGKADWERENLHRQDAGLHSHQVIP